MTNPIPLKLISQLQKDYEEIRDLLLIKKYDFGMIPDEIIGKKDEGEAYSIAYPIQGVLKYHGFVGDPRNRIPFFPSISFNNTCASTTTYLKFDTHFKEDRAILNGKQINGEKLGRIIFALDYIRRFAHIKTKALLISRNSLLDAPESDIGKGIGTSASGSAALAIGATSIIYDNNPFYTHNRRLISTFSKYLSGSGTRSAAGGFSLWLGHPRIDPSDCYAIKLNRKEHQDFLDNISLLTIPIASDLKTHQAHEIAPKSPFFTSWLSQRKGFIIDFIEALDNKNLQKIGEIAEYDTLCLHTVAMTPLHHQKILAWEPDTLKIMKLLQELQISGRKVYYSIDTGPSLVLLTLKSEKDKIIQEISQKASHLTMIQGKIGGPCRLLNSNDPEVSILKKDIDKFL